mmetsp:Transcript_28542/g.76839  ORF Transcript_28542/g.76839 Transcript_28542/m.76839 type:complete len:284 (+) Transcript_28542:53-904(+)
MFARLATTSRMAAVNGRGAFRPVIQNAAFHASPLLKEDKKEAPAAATTAAPIEEAPAGGIGARFISAAEVTVSKIFPAGFGWQGSSIVADGMGFQPDQLGFFTITGGGDFVGVFTGHTLYYGIKKATVDPSIDMGEQIGSGVWLASAAFCSGFAWQPIVNFWQGMNVDFNTVFLGTWAGCGVAFYTGLRAGRVVMPWMPNGDYRNLKNDASLSAAIGGATAVFVGTDTAYNPDQNWLKGVVGIEDNDADLTGMIKAGSSTALGFAVTQSVLNVTYPAGKLWND